jgi:acyl-CoA thioesterase
MSCCFSTTYHILAIDAPFVAHSLHAYFMLAGDDTYPILYQVGYYTP